MDLMAATMDACDSPNFSDVASYDKSRSDIHAEFAEIYATKCHLDKDAFMEVVGIKVLPDGSVNSGNGATRTLKFYTKLHRQLGIHVS